MICTWKYDDSDDCWETSCGNTFILLDGSPEDNGMKYCCYCGLRLSTYTVFQVVEEARYAMVAGNTSNEPIPKGVVEGWLQAIADAI